MKKIFIGADHNGFAHKERLQKWLEELKYEVVDVGDEQLNPDDDYPEFAGRLASKMLASDDHEPMGILLCGSGQGMAIGANRFKGIRAVVCWNEKTATMSRHDDDANVLCLSAWDLDGQKIKNIVKIWLETPFDKAVRYQRRVRELDNLG